MTQVPYTPWGSSKGRGPQAIELIRGEELVGNMLESALPHYWYKTTHFEYQTHSFILTNYKLLFGYNDG